MDSPAVPLFAGKIWRNSLGVALVTFLFFLCYVLVLDGNFSLKSWSKMVAGTSGFLLAYSLSLSTIGYYFNFLDSKVIYRKYLGLLGYYFALLYSIMLLFVDPERYFYGFIENFWTADFVLGLSAMAILTAMALVSNNTAIKVLGPIRWRKILRLGYLAFFLLVIRGAVLEGNLWVSWIVSGNGLPPVRLLLSVVAIFVIFTHYSLYFAEWRKKKPLSKSASLPPETGQAPVVEKA